jgi:DNA-binding NarL/FixJ family response regulator
LPATPIQKSAAPESVLVIDNDEAARKALEGALTRQGYQVKGSADVDEALMMARTGPIDVIIVGEAGATGRAGVLAAPQRGERRLGGGGDRRGPDQHRADH